ncbi:hypothetical protein BU24DRAFT_253405 [Aaosphaeria arxii CBS 175.79]|uniref:F-box domain-containing protein n=1 Tax=Aaosphaeria arxii CBS 175.79 TaxID=1450172 RepID=A0A6A5XH13_9PLEO|nr:uncharacterized protein BU24DRAFT_253405 [Aaosphaeria arxii CBS 175.79]KAF2012525.1 hypothetical protein BU24DRAFT_253405 [Aaosphaeria arxii CBS 175.79]
MILSSEWWSFVPKKGSTATIRVLRALSILYSSYILRFSVARQITSEHSYSNMGHISQLPNEILLEIFEHVKHSGPVHLSNAMQCCRAWYAPAGSILYRNVHLDSNISDDSPAALFMRSLKSNKAYQVQCLSIRISRGHLIGLRNETPRSYQRLLEILEGLPLLDRLTTFSLAMQERGRGAPYPIPSGVISKLLANLPMTVRSLNLECDAPDASVPAAGACMCKTLGALLPQLRHLRLRLPHCCHSLFDELTRTRDSSYPLEHAVIRLDVTPTSLNFEPSSEQATGIGKTICALQEAGTFPMLRRFAIIDRVDCPPSPRNDIWSVFRVRNIQRNSVTTTIFPWCARGGSSSLYMIRDSEGDWFGSFQDVSSALEGDLSWTGNCQALQPRRSRSSESDLVSNAPWLLDRSSLSSRDYVSKNFGVSFRLWKHEDMIGRRLLQVYTTPGFVDTRVLTEEVPYGWGWARGGPWGWTLQRMV